MIQGETYTVHIGNNLDILPTLADNSVDSIVTDPPYELGFMGKKWDSSGIAYSVELWRECLRVLKPGGHLLAFSGSRTYHRMVVAIEDAGFEVRDMISWISNKTFPKSHNLDGNWKGWGTGLKPTVEPIVLARKPLIGTVADNVLTHGTGALNIDGSRIEAEDQEELEKNWDRNQSIAAQEGRNSMSGGLKTIELSEYKASGRWPANVILDEYSAKVLDEQSGMTVSKSSSMKAGLVEGIGAKNLSVKATSYQSVRGHNDTGGASRFFFVARASKRDRNEGLENSNSHPTVKPTQLMRYLVKLVTPPGGTVLDPFTGSGSTGKAAILEGFRFIGCELTEDYIPIIEGRLKHAELMKAELEAKEDEALF
jgi:site-specific DNA-methyltransferase (adenine-specific)